MTTEELLAHCLAKGGAYVDHPFGEETVCVKVKGKIAAMFFTLRGERAATFKCDAMTGDDYRRRYPGVVERGYHSPPVQQPYWNTVRLDGGIPDGELLAMADHAYEAVVAKLPAKARRELEQSGSSRP